MVGVQRELVIFRPLCHLSCLWEIHVDVILEKRMVITVNSVRKRGPDIQIWMTLKKGEEKCEK